MASLIAPPHTEDGTDGAHLQQDALAHGESCSLVVILFPSLSHISRTRRCPNKVGQSGMVWGSGSNWGRHMPHLTKSPCRTGTGLCRQVRGTAAAARCSLANANESARSASRCSSDTRRVLTSTTTDPENPCTARVSSNSAHG